MEAKPPENTARFCRLAEFVADEDSCQAHPYQRCIHCGANKERDCQLDENNIGYKHTAAVLAETNQVEKIHAAIAYGKMVAKELVRVERIRQGAAAEQEVIVPTVSGWLYAWRFISTGTTILVLIHSVASIFQ